MASWWTQHLSLCLLLVSAFFFFHQLGPSSCQLSTRWLPPCTYCPAVGMTLCPVCDIPDAAHCLGHGCLQGTSISPAGERSAPSVSFPTPAGLEAQLVLASGYHSSLPEFAVLTVALSLGLVSQQFYNFLRTWAVTSAAILSWITAYWMLWVPTAQ